MQFPLVNLSDDQLRLREEVRRFVATELADRPEWTTWISGRSDPGFSQRLASQGWVGMSIPTEYGGHGRSAVERFIIVEELLAAKAPMAYHWVADRQIGPSIARLGTTAQKDQFLPAIAAGRCGFALGMSEPDAGSDLASVRTRAVRDGDGWRVSGTKIWTSGAHHADYIMTLCRTSPDEGDRHGGLSQLIMDLHGQGVTVTPIPSLDGGHYFNEVLFEEAFVPDEMVLGEVGSGWRQVTSELVHERSGPDRWLSTFGLFQLFVEWAAKHGDSAAHGAVGQLLARYRVVRSLSLSVASMLDGSVPCAAETAVIKDLATNFEREVVDVAQRHLPLLPERSSSEVLGRVLENAVLTAPSLTLRGGTTEIMRTVGSKELVR